MPKLGRSRHVEGDDRRAGRLSLRDVARVEIELVGVHSAARQQHRCRRVVAGLRVDVHGDVDGFPGVRNRDHAALEVDWKRRRRLQEFGDLIVQCLDALWGCNTRTPRPADVLEVIASLPEGSRTKADIDQRLAEDRSGWAGRG